MERVLDDAHRRRLIDLNRVAAYVAARSSARVPGAPELRGMIAIRNPQRPVGSDLESLFLSLLRRVGLPLPVPQCPVHTRNGVRFIDFAYPDDRVAIELDGDADHNSPTAYVGDRIRQNELEALGWHVFRFTWSQVTRTATDVVTTVADSIGMEPSRWRRKPFNETAGPRRHGHR